MSDWQTKSFKTKWAMDCFIIPRVHTHQFTEVFAESGFKLEFRRIKRNH